jgi:hypothetical protein
MEMMNIFSKDFLGISRAKAFFSFVSFTDLPQKYITYLQKYLKIFPPDY